MDFLKRFVRWLFPTKKTCSHLDVDVKSFDQTDGNIIYEYTCKKCNWSFVSQGV